MCRCKEFMANSRIPENEDDLLPGICWIECTGIKAFWTMVAVRRLLQICCALEEQPKALQYPVLLNSHIIPLDMATICSSSSRIVNEGQCTKQAIKCYFKTVQPSLLPLYYLCCFISMLIICCLWQFTEQRKQKNHGAYNINLARGEMEAVYTW